MADHALLSASGSKKWLTCTPSARLEEQFQDEQSVYAAEGTKAHDLMEIVCKHWYHGGPTLTESEMAEAGYTAEMIDAVRVFLNEALSITEPLRIAGKAYTVLIEQRLDYSQWVPEGFGTGDLVVVSEHCIWVRDLKYGKGVAVQSEENYQMMLYALGAYSELSFAYDEINELDVGIIQPRISNNTSWRVPLKTLLAWGDSIKPAAQLAWEGKGEFRPGSHCTEGFCRARFTCAARAKANLAAATEEFGDLPELLDNDQIAALLPRLDDIESWAKELKSYALTAAVDKGVRFKGYKLVEGRSNRYINDKKMALVRLVANGYQQEEVQTEPALLGITALEELVGGKKAFNELLGDIISKPPGKPVLVPAADKRQEWRPTASADEDFG